MRTSPPTSPGATANTSGVDTVSAGGTNSGNASSGPSTTPLNSPGRGSGKGKSPASGGRQSSEMVDQRPKVISPELRELLSRKVEVLPRKVVRKGGEGLSSLKK
jgi:hypothetical protein